MDRRISHLWKLLLLSPLCLSATLLHGQGTAFDYQGALNNAGKMVTGLCDFRFTVYDSTNLPGNTMAGPLTNSAVLVSNGVFNTTLDFGAVAFTGCDRYLQVDLRTNSKTAFISLSPRQRFMSLPYAIMANTASNLIGTLPVTQLPVSVLTNGGSQALLTGHFYGQFAGDASGLTNLNASQITSGTLPLSQLPPEAVTLPANTVKVMSSGLTFSNLWMASANALPGDTIIVAGGNYAEGNHVCSFPRNVTVLPLGTAQLTIALTNGFSAMDASHVYIQPTDNMHIYRGLVITEITRNNFNAIFGAVATTPAATNWMVELESPQTDSDGVYLSNVHPVQGTIQNSRFMGYWDAFAAINTAPNTDIRCFNCLFSPNNTNQPDPSVKRAVNLSFCAGKFTFDSCTFQATQKRGTAITYGIQNESLNSKTIVNNGIFQVADFDVYNSGPVQSLVLDQCSESSGNPLSCDTSQSSYGAGLVEASMVAMPAVDYPDGGISLGDWLLFVETNDAAANIIFRSTNNYAGNTPDVVFRNFNWDGNGGLGGVAANQFWGAFSGSGAGLTNLSASRLSGTISTTNLPGITGSIPIGGVTLHITNGLIMRVSSP